jgi:hypothetical protein
MKAKIINSFDWYSNKVGIIVKIKECEFPNLYLAYDETTLCNRHILRVDVEVLND